MASPDHVLHLPTTSPPLPYSDSRVDRAHACWCLCYPMCVRARARCISAHSRPTTRGDASKRPTPVSRSLDQQRGVDAQTSIPTDTGLSVQGAFKNWMIHEDCMSQYFSHFAAFFIVARAKRSIVKSCFSCSTTPLVFRLLATCISVYKHLLLASDEHKLAKEMGSREMRTWHGHATPSQP